MAGSAQRWVLGNPPSARPRKAPECAGEAVAVSLNGAGSALGNNLIAAGAISSFLTADNDNRASECANLGRIAA